MTLTLSRDRKVSPRSRWSNANQRWEPVSANSFGLPAVISCPGATDQCRAVCYAARTERTFTSAGRLVSRNWEALQACGDNVDAMASLLRATIDAWELEHNKRSPDAAKVFRIHWDGDFYSIPYAEAWRRVILATPHVRYWAYTRSFVPACDVVPTLATLPNLALYLSVDRYNVAWADVVTALYPTVRVATMADTFADAADLSVALRDRNAPACPENAKRVPLVDDDGTGACVTCGLCVNGRADVRFSISHK